MARRIDQVLIAAAQRPLSAGELDLLSSYIRDLERRQARPADVLERELARTRDELKDCRQQLRRADRNGNMD